MCWCNACPNILECDKTICWNELGRMMVWCGDRLHASTFFRKSLEVVLDILADQQLMTEKRMENAIHHKLVFYSVD